ncbi:hypothetical protein [Rufibacter roseus]|uniref:DUF4345 domain-containing protein n=1 Tax=Rufibacter roseus TaxID=1567108 RepID=A0ABW2DRS3_9BACT|nr:hypothetical protein [Rufibacter roseus]
MRKAVLWFQGIFYALTGIWPLVHMPSFLAVTGPKNEVWLVEVVGVLVLAVGAAFITSALSKTEEKSMEVLGLFSALGLGAMDVRYATHDVIRDVYLLDAAVEFLLVLAWAWILFTQSRKQRTKTS